MKTIKGVEMVEMTAWVEREKRDSFKKEFPQGAFSFYVRKMIDKKLSEAREENDEKRQQG